MGASVNSIPHSFECPSVGDYSLGGSCSTFIQCVEEQDGVLAPILQSCPPSMAFSPLAATCMDRGMVKGCNVTMARSGKVHEAEYDYLCSVTNNQYVCANCRTMVNCVNGRAYPVSCLDGNYCHVDEENFGGGVCYPDLPEACVCLEPDVFYQDKYDPRTFYVCDALGDTQMHHCPSGYVFDRDSLECRSETGLPTCTLPGTFSVESDCSRYYACIITTEGWLQHEFKCPSNKGTLFYNEITETCDDPCSWPDTNFECKEEGRFTDPLDCRSFYVCTWDPKMKKFRKVQRRCPEGYEWQQVLRTGVGLCSVMVNHECTAITATQCTIPPGLCTSQ